MRKSMALLLLMVLLIFMDVPVSAVVNFMITVAGYEKPAKSNFAGDFTV